MEFRNSLGHRKCVDAEGSCHRRSKNLGILPPMQHSQIRESAWDFPAPHPGVLWIFRLGSRGFEARIPWIFRLGFHGF